MTVPFALWLAIQVAQAGVTGTVRDELTGIPLSDALITLSDDDRRVLTDAEGRFRVSELAPGPHHVTIVRHGFRARTLHALVPRHGIVELNVALQPIPVELVGLVVEPRLAIRGTEALDRTRGSAEPVSLGAARNHPLIAEADVFRVLEGGDVTSLPESPAGLHIRGGAASHTAFELDGIPILGPLHAAGLISAWNPDALASVGIDHSPGGTLASLSGTVIGETRSPGRVTRASTVLSTSQARISVDGPLFETGGAYLLSARGGLPSGVVPPRDPAKIRGEAGDLLAKVEVAFLGGAFELLGYDSENELNTGTIAEAPSNASLESRNRFEWATRALGAIWGRDLSPGRIEARAWDSRGSGSISLPSDGTDVRNRRVERGLSATLTRRGAGGEELTLGTRLNRSSTEYESGGVMPFLSNGALTIGTASLVFDTPLGRRSGLRSEFVVAGSSLGARASPLLTATTRLRPSVELSASLSRRYQFSQSLRNEESLLGAVFPTDLSVSAGSDGVPVARADEISARVEYRPAPGVKLGSKGYVRRLESVVFVAAQTGSLFSTGGFDVGSTDIAGVSVDAALSGSRYGIVADYAAQSVRNAVPGRSYTPSYAPAHRAQAGVVFHPSPTMSLRMSHTAIWGRRSTTLDGAVEWESCNLLDGGCELAGAPPHTDALGEARLGSYMRTDVGLRKHWHLGIGGRDSMLAVYGTVTNLFGRSNTMTYAIDSVSGALESVDMLPLAPLVVGLELVF